MKITKRLLAMLLTLSVLMSITACGGPESANIVVPGDIQNVVDVIGNNRDVEVSTDENGNTFINRSEDSEVNKDVLMDLIQQPGATNEDAVSMEPLNVDKTPIENTVLTDNQTSAEDNHLAENDFSTEQSSATAPRGDYNPGVVLVKVKEEYHSSALGTLEYVTAEPLYKNSKWYTVKLANAEKTEEAVAYLSGLNVFEKVDYDYIMGVTGPKEDAEANPKYDDQVNLGLSNIPNGWTVNGKAPGGSPDVVIAVIDTGVDYNHLDLRNNIWINTAEIAGNGKDDDGNGYIDDVYGWDCVGNDNNPMDDNGHGTHVAGIIAAENNKEGGIGVAYNCKVMVLKAGNSSGYFNNSDIAEAIQYAYMNGASVINMSFGGSFVSIAVEEALENAYNSCVLVAAAGNDGACNNLSCKECDNVGVSYPAALPYVIGVMSTDKDGKHISSFSNYDHYPYDSIEYEVYAVGEGVGSTWPSNKYACLNGTSMAAPTVSGIAALLRSYYTDREVYSTKFIQSQIVNTGTVNPHILDRGTDAAHSVADVVEALTKLPKPAVNLYDYYIDDSASISTKNNGNGVIDAGETVRLYISLHNRGGVASNVNVSIDTYRSEIGDEAMTDPYFTFVNSTMQLSDIGTYSVRESGDKYFEIVVSSDCPNDYLVNFNIRYTYTNGMDEKDTAQYEDDGKQQAQFNVSSGYHLPSVISENTTFTNDSLYIVGENVTIPAGVTVTFEEGCRIQFYDDSEYYNSPRILVYGTLKMEGTKENMISIAPSERHANFGCMISNYGTVDINYVSASNLLVTDFKSAAVSEIANSYIRSTQTIYEYEAGKNDTADNMDLDSCVDSYIEITKWNCYGYRIDELNGCYVIFFTNNAMKLVIEDKFVNNIFVTVKNTGHSPNDPIVFGDDCVVVNNYFTSSNDEDLNSFSEFKFGSSATVADNAFSAGYQKYASQVITNYLDSNGNPIVDVYSSCSDISELYPHIVSVEIFNADGEQITTIGKEEIKVRVTFSKAMDTTVNPGVFFGTIEPYADYKIEGAYVSDTVWEGTYTLKAYIENGIQQMIVKGACAADDITKVVLGEYQLYEFNIDTTAAMSMNLFATATDHGIELTWNQDDYDTLMGYNIYRADSKDGNYVKINPSVLLPTDSSFVDDNAEPGKTYWYTFTVVLSDFSESAPTGKVYCTAVDTLEPTIYHTPVNQGYAENNLVISCTASDNMAIASVTLYYRTVGSDTWKSLVMSKVNDKYSATIFGSELTLDGIEYYIVATDGVNTVSKGTADESYTVVIKDASSISRIGDVDGSGSVTTKDALMLMTCLNGDLILSDDEFKRADLNGDGQLSSAEALRILQYVNGKVTTLEM